MNDEINSVLDELKRVFENSQIEFESITEKIYKSNNIVCLGAGRVGLVMEAFAKRLTHLGKSSYAFTDSNLPRITQGDLLIVGSGSGNTKSILTIAKIAEENGIDIVLFTANPDSEISRLSTLICSIKSPFKGNLFPEFISIQPMTTLFEQSLYIWLDGLVLYYMKKYSISEAEMKDRHNGLE